MQAVWFLSLCFKVGLRLGNYIIGWVMLEITFQGFHKTSRPTKENATNGKSSLFLNIIYKRHKKALVLFMFRI